MKINPYCLHPFINFTLESGGHIRLCCSTEHSLGVITEIENIKEFWKNSKEINLIRSQMISGNSREDICSLCIETDRKNLKSKRIRFFEKNEKNFFIDSNVYTNPEIYDVDISFSRTCNLQCATCNSKYSSKWFNDDRKRQKLDIIKHLDLNQFINNNPLLSPSQLQQLIDICSNAKTIVIKGGEPFLDDSFKKFIKNIKHKEDKSIHVVTNGTVYDLEILENLFKFKKYVIVISIDGVKEIHKWIRRADEKDYENIRKNSSFLKTINSNCVVSAFNIFTIDKLVEEFINENNFSYSNISFFSVAGSPLENFLVFDLKYFPFIIEKIEKCIDLIKKSSCTFIDIEQFYRLLNYVKSDNYIKYHQSHVRQKFLLNYEKILLPSRGYCLSTIDPIFGKAYQDLKDRYEK